MDDKVAEVKRLYLTAKKATITRYVDEAIAILRSMSSDEDRERAAVFMDGLVQMRSEWGLAPTAGRGKRASTDNATRKAERAK